MCDVPDASHDTWINHESFFVVGAIFGDVGLVLFVAGATCREILRDTRTTKRCTVPYRTRLRNGTGKVSEAAVARSRFLILGISSECRRIVFILAEAIHGFFGQILNSKFRGRRNIW